MEHFDMVLDLLVLGGFATTLLTTLHLIATKDRRKMMKILRGLADVLENLNGNSEENTKKGGDSL